MSDGAKQQRPSDETSTDRARPTNPRHSEEDTRVVLTSWDDHLVPE